MSVSYVNKNSAVGKSVQLTGVTSGNLIVCLLQWQDNTTTPTLSDGTNSPTGYSTIVNADGQELIRLAYWLSSPKSDTVTYTWTASGGGHTAHVFEMAVTAGNTWELEHIDAGAISGSGATATSGNESATNPSMVGFGAAGFYDANDYSSALIDGSSVDQHTETKDTSYGSSGFLTMRILNNPGTYASAITSSASDIWSADLIGFREVVSSSPTLEQEGFRFRNDDGSESTATWKADQDTSITLAADTAARLRVILNATGDPASIEAQLEYRYKPSGGSFGDWKKIT